jgi:hypothetical protein
MTDFLTDEQWIDVARFHARVAINRAQDEHRAHSLIDSRRFWQPVATAPGVVAWGYAYEGGQFNRPAYSRSAAHDAIARYIAAVSR